MTYRKLAEQNVQNLKLTSCLRQFRLDDIVKQKIINAGVQNIQDILSIKIDELKLKPLEIKRFRKMIMHIQNI